MSISINLSEKYLQDSHFRATNQLCHTGIKEREKMLNQISTIPPKTDATIKFIVKLCHQQCVKEPKYTTCYLKWGRRTSTVQPLGNQYCYNVTLR